MMYHFLTDCGSPVPASLIALLLLWRPRHDIASNKETEYSVHNGLQQGIDQEQIQTEKEDGHQDDDRRPINLFLTGPGDLSELRLDVAVEIRHTAGSVFQLFQHKISSKEVAGQEGIEPPTPGFGDRCSAN